MSTNFAIYKNKIKKEMSEIPNEDLKIYRAFEWRTANQLYGDYASLMVEIRDILGLSVEDCPVTDEEMKVHKPTLAQQYELEAKMLRQEKEQKRELALKEKQEAWDRLTPKEQSAQLKQKFVFLAFSGILIISGIVAYYVV